MFARSARVFFLSVLAALAAFALSPPAVSDDVGRPARTGPAGIFGSLEFIGGSLRALPQWTRVLDKIKEENVIYAACDADARKCPSPAAAAWRASKRRVEGLKPLEQLREINRFLNSWVYREDVENYGVNDFWASPLQFISQSGDCEDYAIIKYVTLRELGFPAEKLRIVVLQDTLRAVPHAVLAVYLDDRILIMDSLFDAILPDTQVTFYVPQYSVNETTRWAHVMPIRPAAGPSPGVKVQ
jgi:predicted transglutaminase-like cysteine proteinase